MTIKLIGRWDSGIKLLRVARLSWNAEPKQPGFGTQLSLGLRWNKLFGYVRGYREHILTVCGVRLHYRTASGGRFTA